MIYKFTVHQKTATDNSVIDRLKSALEIKDLNVLRDYYIEVERPLTQPELKRIGGALGDSLTETVEVGAPLKEGQMVQVGHKRGIVDNENDSIIILCELLGIRAIAGKMCMTYESTDLNLLQAIRANCYNPNIEEIHIKEPNQETLIPVGYYIPMETYDLRNLSDQELANLGKENGRSLSLRQMKQVKQIQLETESPCVTDVLLEALDARWSDHCSHTTWRSLGNLLGVLAGASKRTRNSNIVSMFHDNAGIWDFYDGFCIAFKAETHNGPSAISAYFGQLTKLGGVLRDILGTGLGADPIGTFEYTATGLPDSQAPIKGRPAPKQIAKETIRAIKEYGNTFGVPMMWSHMTFHPKYRAKPFALGGNIGLIPKEFAEKGSPQPGDFLMLIGGLTGNEGIHGASASSAGSTMDEAAVQIGSPLEQVKFRQAIIDLRDAGCIRALTDVGGAGLNSAVGEIGEACGVWLNTAVVPLKTSGLPMWRILLSESQERMILAVVPDKLIEARDILDRHKVRHTVAGRFTDTNRYCVVYDEQVKEEEIVRVDYHNMPTTGELGFDVPYRLLNYEPQQQTLETHQIHTDQSNGWPSISPEGMEEIVCRIVADAEISDQTYAGRQYDSTVQGRTIYGPYYGNEYYVPTSYWAGIPIYEKPYAVVFSTAFNPWLYEAHPVLAARQCFLSLLGGQVLAGVKLKDVCLCDNFYTPHLERDGHSALVEMVRELASLVELFGTPFISGKDSSAGSTNTDEGLVSVPPTVFLSAVGKVRDKSILLPNQWQSPGNLIVRIGPDSSSLAGTLAARIFQTSANDVDEVSPVGYKEYLEALSTLPGNLLHSGTPIGVGGVLGQLILGVIGSGLGVEISDPTHRLSELLEEHRCGAIIEVSENDFSRLPAVLRPRVVARITGERHSISYLGNNILSRRAIDIWHTAYEESLQ